MRVAAALVLSLAGAVIAAKALPNRSNAKAGIGDIVEVSDGILVRPRRLVDLGHCLAPAKCTSTGRLVLDTTVIEEGKKTRVRLVQGHSINIDGGTLILTGVQEPSDWSDLFHKDEFHEFNFSFVPRKLAGSG
jgi:hypothetical protein